MSSAKLCSPAKEVMVMLIIPWSSLVVLNLCKCHDVNLSKKGLAVKQKEGESAGSKK